MSLSSFVHLERVSFKYDEQNILSDISLDLPKGSFSVLIGPNGGGKTTLLKLILGFLSPHRGSILLDQKTPKEFRPKAAYVPQYLSFDRVFPISLIDLVLMGALHRYRWYRGYLKEDKERAYALLREMGLEDKANQPIGALSGGQLQRGLIARALLSEPELLLLDEPTSNIDSRSEGILYSKLESLAGNITIMMVSHDLNSISRNVDRVLYTHQKVELLSPEEVCSHYTMGVYHPPLTDKSCGDSC